MSSNAFSDENSQQRQQSCGDADLKRFKEMPIIWRLGRHFNHEDMGDLLHLIARLEAAERAIFSLETVILWMSEEERYKKLSAADLVWIEGAKNSLQVWKKSAGKL